MYCHTFRGFTFIYIFCKSPFNVVILCEDLLAGIHGSLFPVLEWFFMLNLVSYVIDLLLFIVYLPIVPNGGEKGKARHSSQRRPHPHPHELKLKLLLLPLYLSLQHVSIGMSRWQAGRQRRK